jgi:hypothetical protein
MSLQDAQDCGLSKPERRPVVEHETLIRGRRTKTNDRYRVRISRSLAEQLQGLGSPAFPGAESLWRERVKKIFRDAGVTMTPHGFRHYRISEWLAQGFQPSDVSKWVGASEKEIRKTYEHWIQEAEDRLDNPHASPFMTPNGIGGHAGGTGKQVSAKCARLAALLSSASQIRHLLTPSPW